MFQGQAKKSVVMSSEAMKEMQKQAKANKDERRQHVRHRYLLHFILCGVTAGYSI